jgi:hypothetical protein
MACPPLVLKEKDSEGNHEIDEDKGTEQEM